MLKQIEGDLKPRNNKNYNKIFDLNIKDIKKWKIYFFIISLYIFINLFEIAIVYFEIIILDIEKFDNIFNKYIQIIICFKYKNYQSFLKLNIIKYIRKLEYF